MFFSGGDVPSTMLMRRTLKAFANSSGLEASPSGTIVYFSNVPKKFREGPFKLQGSKKGEFPFRYFGIPITSRKLPSVIVTYWWTR